MRAQIPEKAETKIVVPAPSHPSLKILARRLGVRPVPSLQSAGWQAASSATRSQALQLRLRLRPSPRIVVTTLSLDWTHRSLH